MELMRHTDLRLTMKVYTDPRIFNLAGAVERLPMPAVAIARVAKRVANSLSEGQSQSGTGDADSLASETQVVQGNKLSHRPAPTDSEGPEGEKSSAGRTRTYQNPWNSSENRAHSVSSGSKQGSEFCMPMPADVCPELCEVIEAWARLPAAVTAGILAIVRASKA
jgi:hypothetical protein